jgi:hypothetical protein
VIEDEKPLGAAMVFIYFETMIRLPDYLHMRYYYRAV